MQIRPAQETDIPQLCKLRKQIAEYHLQFDSHFALAPNAMDLFAQHLRMEIANVDTCLLVAVEEDHVIGFANGRMIQSPVVFEQHTKGFVDEFGIDARHRSKGIGTLLLNELLNWFKQRGAVRAQLKVSKPNQSGYNFWRKHGFEDVVIQMIKPL